MKIVIDTPDVSMQAYQDLYYKIYHMAVNEGLFDDRVKSQRALALKAVLDVLNGLVKGTPIPDALYPLIAKLIEDAKEESEE